MKKIITTIAFIAMSTVSAKAIDLSFLSVTAGLASNTGVFGASALEKHYSADASNTLRTTNSADGVFTENYGSQFVELGLGNFISLGFESTPNSIDTATVTSNEGDTKNEISVSADFADLETTYVKLNIPGGLYLKWGTTETRLDIKTSRGTYKDANLEGTSIGTGYERLFGESGFGFRIETAYLSWDDVNTNDGDTVGTTANNGKNEVSAKNIEGLTAKVALTYTLGRNY